MSKYLEFAAPVAVPYTPEPTTREVPLDDVAPYAGTVS